jgi:hypothetical protein
VAYRLGGGRSIHLSYEGAGATVAGASGMPVGPGTKRRSGGPGSVTRWAVVAVPAASRCRRQDRVRALCALRQGLAVRSAAVIDIPTGHWFPGEHVARTLARIGD